jgi:predicted nucleic acid-binding protein
VIRDAQAIFVDTGAWIALALTKDPYHERAREAGLELAQAGARLHTSVSVVLETFTFLDRQTTREVATAWRQSLATIPRLRVWPVTPRDLANAWVFFDRTDLHKLSAVDAVSFVLMRRAKIRFAFAFDHHFATAGFRLIG